MDEVFAFAVHVRPGVGDADEVARFARQGRDEARALDAFEPPGLEDAAGEEGARRAGGEHAVDVVAGLEGLEGDGHRAIRLGAQEVRRVVGVEHRLDGGQNLVTGFGDVAFFHRFADDLFRAGEDQMEIGMFVQSGQRALKRASGALSPPRTSSKMFMDVVPPTRKSYTRWPHPFNETRRCPRAFRR